MTDYSLPCDWCETVVVSFAQPPMMIKIEVQPYLGDPHHVWRVCAECYTEMIKLIANRAKPIAVVQSGGGNGEP